MKRVPYDAVVQKESLSWRMSLAEHLAYTSPPSFALVAFTVQVRSC